MSHCHIFILVYELTMYHLPSRRKRQTARFWPINGQILRPDSFWLLCWAILNVLLPSFSFGPSTGPISSTSLTKSSEMASFWPRNGQILGPDWFSLLIWLILNFLLSYFHLSVRIGQVSSSFLTKTWNVQFLAKKWTDLGARLILVVEMGNTKCLIAIFLP